MIQMMITRNLQLKNLKLKDRDMKKTSSKNDSKSKTVSEKPVWCEKCCLRIAPYDLRTVSHGKDYHRDCYARMTRSEEPDERHEEVPGNLTPAPAGVVN